MDAKIFSTKSYTIETQENYEFKEAEKKIKSKEVLEKILQGESIKKIIDYICFLQKSIEGFSAKDTPFPEEKEIFKNFRSMFEDLYKLLDDTPPFENPQRFGNKAFAAWCQKVEGNYTEIIQKLLGDKYNEGIALELKSYFLDCFGSEKRIDYGTGHEMNFLCILYILTCTGFLVKEDARAIIHHIFFPYIFLVRKIQLLYKLEPAGAHGVWGLDEYHFLPFLFGASELIDNDLITPNSVLSERTIKDFSDTYMYLSCVQHVCKVKTGGSFENHSPTLASISHVPNWRKVAQGLVKMYYDEFFKKYVIMQHFYFGSVIRFE